MYASDKFKSSDSRPIARKLPKASSFHNFSDAPKSRDPNLPKSSSLNNFRNASKPRDHNLPKSSSLQDLQKTHNFDATKSKIPAIQPDASTSHEKPSILLNQSAVTETLNKLQSIKGKLPPLNLQQDLFDNYQWHKKRGMETKEMDEQKLTKLQELRRHNVLNHMEYEKSILKLNIANKLLEQNFYNKQQNDISSQKQEKLLLEHIYNDSEYINKRYEIYTKHNKYQNYIAMLERIEKYKLTDHLSSKKAEQKLPLTPNEQDIVKKYRLKEILERGTSDDLNTLEGILEKLKSRDREKKEK